MSKNSLFRGVDMMCYHVYKSRHFMWVDSVRSYQRNWPRIVSSVERKWDMGSIRWERTTLKSLWGHLTFSFYRYILPVLILKVDSSKKQRMKKIFNYIIVTFANAHRTETERKHSTVVMPR